MSSKSTGLAPLWMVRVAGELPAAPRGPLRASPRHIAPDRKPAYQWMAEQHARRVGPAPRGVRWPLWAWRAWDGEARPRPDQRAAGHLIAGTEAVLLELRVRADRLLVSDVERWHAVLNRHYLATSEADDDRFAQRLRKAGRGSAPAERCLQ